LMVDATNQLIRKGQTREHLLLCWALSVTSLIVVIDRKTHLVEEFVTRILLLLQRWPDYEENGEVLQFSLVKKDMRQARGLSLHPSSSIRLQTYNEQLTTPITILLHLTDCANWPGFNVGCDVMSCHVMWWHLISCQKMSMLHSDGLRAENNDQISSQEASEFPLDHSQTSKPVERRCPCFADSSILDGGRSVKSGRFARGVSPRRPALDHVDFLRFETC
jgi:hypothetical protein